MRINFAARWASAAVLFALSVTTAMAQALHPANVEGTDEIPGRVEVYNLSSTRLPASSIFRCTERGCRFVKLSIVVKPPEVQIIQFDNITGEERDRFITRPHRRLHFREMSGDPIVTRPDRTAMSAGM